MLFSSLTRRSLTAGAIAGLAAMMTVPAQAQVYNSTLEVMTGLRNPRGLTVGPDGSLYVAESGIGGNTGNPIEGANTEDYEFGLTGAISRVLGGTQQQIIAGLPSLADQNFANNDRPSAAPAGSDAVGVQDIAFRNGNLYGLVGFIGAPALRNEASLSGTGDTFWGRVVRFNQTGGIFDGTFTSVADITALEVSNPDGSDVNSNPYGLVATASGFVVSDAGGNHLIGVTETAPGSDTYTTSSLEIFPEESNLFFNPTPPPPSLGGPTYQAVPTGVTAGPGGTVFVGQLTGFPFPAGNANIFQVDSTGTIINTIGGFTAITDLTFDNGNLYVLQYASGPVFSGVGQVWQYELATGNRTLLYSGLTNPTSIAVANGNIYVTDAATLPGGGRVLQLTIVAPEPGTLALLGIGSLTLGLVRRQK